MSTYTADQFKALYGSLGSIFPDNTTGLISEGDMRQFGEDIADSFSNLTSSSYIDTLAVVTTGGTITLNFASKADRIFVGATSFATAKIIDPTNDTVAKRLQFIFTITNVAAVLTFPSDFIMNDVRWNTGTQEWTPDETGTYKTEAVYDGTNWILDISQPYA